ncbi:hypothetical protein Bbelb_288220 [Branchiostoma belcheri]|nr:hypothetical protein Bbelb_288220 [Branchiostoma belcheri]
MGSEKLYDMSFHGADRGKRVSDGPGTLIVATASVIVSFVTMFVLVRQGAELGETKSTISRFKEMEAQLSHLKEMEAQLSHLKETETHLKEMEAQLSHLKGIEAQLQEMRQWREHLSVQIDDNIKFTQEPSHGNMLPFLDTKTIVEEDGNLRFEVYRKPTHTDQYLAFDSHHPLEHKLAVIKTLFHRADNIITSDQAKTDEHRHLRGALAKCGYQNWTFNKALKPSDQSKKTQKCKPLTNKNKANITIPYVQGVSEKLRRIFQNFNIATNFKPHSTLRQRLVHPKDRPYKGTKANVIYRLKCEEPNCNNTYIGETSRPLKVRYKEHCRPSANGYSSAIFHHLQHNQGHSFKLESTDILDRETRWWERGVKEAIYERMYNPTLNREGGLRVDLSGTWDLTLKLLFCITGAPGTAGPTNRFKLHGSLRRAPTVVRTEQAKAPPFCTELKCITGLRDLRQTPEVLRIRSHFPRL